MPSNSNARQQTLTRCCVTGELQSLKEYVVQHVTTRTINVLLWILDIVCKEVGQLVIQMPQHLQGIFNKEDCVVLPKQDPFVVVYTNCLVCQEWRHGRPRHDQEQMSAT